MPTQPYAILLTGATGYVGGRLLPRLLERGERVRCLARRPEHLRSRAPAGTDIVQGDVLDASTLAPAMTGCDVVYYLVHSMGRGHDFADADRRAAENVGRAAREAGIRRIIYLGGLADPADDLSPHLRSRLEVGEVLRASGVPTVEFRASIIIGSGSLSFELVRALTERLPVMVCPRWVRTPAQPIAIEDVLDYLVAALDLPETTGSRVFEIGGPDRVSYNGLMRAYAQARGLRRLMIPVPVLTPYLSSLWLGLVTPVYARIGRSLIEGVRNASVVRDASALEVFAVRPRGLREAIRRALANEDRALAETRWSDALAVAGAPRSWAGIRFGNRIVESTELRVPVTPEQAFEPIQQLGGDTGWYCCDILWRLRGALDLVVGGVGMRRGRPHPERLRVGDPLDFWRVEAIEPGRRLRLAAEMKLPGRAWLEFTVTPEDGGARIRQTAIFDPVGLAGLAYWYALYPLHRLIFAGMLRSIVARARRADTARDRPARRAS